MADTTIEELVAATTLNDDDLLVVQQGNFAKKLSGKTLLDYIYNKANYVTPEMFGAIGDGETDDTEAIQIAVNSGEMVYISGTYKISSGIQLVSNSSIVGKGSLVKDSTVESYYSALYNYDNDIENVIIDGIRIVGVKHWTGQTISGKANDSGIWIKNGKNIIVNGCLIEECGARSIGVSGEDFEITNNTIRYTGEFSGEIPNYNFGISYSGQSCRIIGNKISGVIQGIISGITNKNVIIANNDISTNGQHGLYMEGANNVQVVDNIIHDCSLCGIKFQIGTILQTFCGIVIANNIVKNCEDHGILIIDLEQIDILSDITIIGNYIYGTTSGIHVGYSNSVIISDNIIKNIVSYAIRIGNTSNISINNNKIVSVNCNAIHFSDGIKNKNKNISVKNNTITYSGTGTWYGITVYTGENIVISENELVCEANGNTKVGIKISNTTDSIEYMYIRDNFIRGFSENYSQLNPDGITVENNHFI